MKKLIVILTIALLPSIAEAQSEQRVEEVRVSAAAPRFALPAQRRNMWATEFEQVQGAYTLSNGKTMQLSQWGNRMYAKIDGMPRTQLIAETPWVFVARDEHMKIYVDTVTGARIQAQVLMITPQRLSGIGNSVVTRLVAHR